MPQFDLDTLKRVILTCFPDLAPARFYLMPAGWHSTAVDADDTWVFKFPRGADAEAALRTEARLLAAVRPHVTMSVPDLSLIEGARLFSRHRKLKGEQLLSSHYAALDEEARRGLAAAMARFYADLHALDLGKMRTAGATAIEPWLKPDEILRRAMPLLPSDLRPYAERLIASWRELPPDPHGTIYGFFDGHGWNMAFDHAAQRLNGVYDFADSGFGQLHQEFIYSNLIARDLTGRIVTDYERLTGRSLDRDRIALLTGVHRLWELAEVADTPEHIPLMLKTFTEWAKPPG